MWPLFVQPRNSICGGWDLTKGQHKAQAPSPCSSHPYMTALFWDAHLAYPSRAHATHKILCDHFLSFFLPPLKKSSLLSFVTDSLQKFTYCGPPGMHVMLATASPSMQMGEVDCARTHIAKLHCTVSASATLLWLQPFFHHFNDFRNIINYVIRHVRCRASQRVNAKLLQQVPASEHKPSF